jgi:hypothetical protein
MQNTVVFPARTWLTVAALMLCLVGCQRVPRPALVPIRSIGEPIVTYWCGPDMTDATANQMREGGWTVAWGIEKDLDMLQRYGLRALLINPLLSPATLDQPVRREQLDALIGRVRSHQALFGYYITDEPSATQFPALGKVVAYLREGDPAHPAYINLFPTYATNAQLGTRGDTVAAYREHLRQYVDQVKPALISYDHYQLATRGDNDQYFLNLALIRRAALDAGVPFLNSVQASSWTSSMRVPTPEEMRFLVYTTLAYGAQGISYYVYSCPGHAGGIASADGTPTPLYGALKTLNREFAAIGAQVQALQSVGAYHAGMLPRGADPLPKDAPFAPDPPVASLSYTPPERVRGLLLGYFAPSTKASSAANATHALVVNLDYGVEVLVSVKAARNMERFDPVQGKWIATGGRVAHLRLPAGGGCLLRTQR